MYGHSDQSTQTILRLGQPAECGFNELASSKEKTKLFVDRKKSGLSNRIRLKDKDEETIYLWLHRSLHPALTPNTVLTNT